MQQSSSTEKITTTMHPARRDQMILKVLQVTSESRQTSGMVHDEDMRLEYCCFIRSKERSGQNMSLLPSSG